MATKSPKQGKKATSRRFRMPHAFPVLLVAIVLLGTASFFGVRLATAPVLDRSVNMLPLDSYAVVTARISELDTGKLRALANSANIGATAAQPRLELLDQLKTKEAQRAFVDQLACGVSTKGTVCVFELKNAAGVTPVNNALQQKLTNLQTVPRGQVDVTVADQPGGGNVSYVFRGTKLIFATTPELVAATAVETTGFTNVPRYGELLKTLGAGADGYLFFNTSAHPTAKFSAPLTAAVWKHSKEGYRLSARSLGTPSTVTPAQSGDRYLLPGEQFPVSISGGNLDQFISIITGERQETDLPKVLQLQNALRSIDQALGTSVEQEYLTTKSFTYARRVDQRDGSGKWAALLEYDSADAAAAKSADLISRVQQKITVPVRKQVVKILPDGSQSREVISEGRIPLTVAPFSSNGLNGQSATIPGSLGPVVLLVKGKFMAIGSDVDSVEAALAATTQKPAEKTTTALRLRIRDAEKLLADPDAISDWVAVTRPTGAEMVLYPSTAEIKGTITFKSPVAQ